MQLQVKAKIGDEANGQKYWCLVFESSEGKI